MATRIIGQSGSDRFLIDVGDPPDPNDHPTARVYNRRDRELFDPFSRDSILARGYWGDPAIDDATRATIEAEVDSLL